MPAKRSFAGRALRTLLVLVAVGVAYPLVAVVLGLVPVNSGFRPVRDGIDIYLVSSGLHSGLAMPVRSDVVDWHRDLPAETAAPSGGLDYVIAGWGDRAVYAEIGGWGNLQPGHVLTAMVGINRSVVRMQQVPRPVPGPKAVPIRISRDAYKRLADYVRASVLRGSDGRPLLVQGRGRHPGDAFYEARGSYSVLYTCNEWTRIGLQRAGIRTALWSPFDQALFHQVRQ